MLWGGYVSNKLYKLKAWFNDPQNKIWITPFFAIILALILLIIAWYLDAYVEIPTNIAINIDTLDAILSIIASSMLAVATFSLGIMVSAFASVSSNITPRATLIVMSDQTTKKAISSFLAAFLYAVIAKIALGQGIYDKNGIYVLFIMTLFVLAYLVFTLIQWVKTLSTLGRLNDTVRKVELVTNKEMEKFCQNPTFNLSKEPLTEHRYHVLSSQIGYLNNIQFKELNAYCEATHTKFDIMLRHGDFVGYQEILCYTNRYIENKDEILQFFIIEETQIYNNNPNYGLLILSEIAQRALSPAINDPGSAVHALTVISKILNQNKYLDHFEESIKYQNLSMIPYDMNKFILPVFGPISKDGSNNIEISIHLQRTLASLYRNKNKKLAYLAQQYAKISLTHGEKSLKYKEEKIHLREIHQTLFNTSRHL